jgi:hypothetical protein
MDCRQENRQILPSQEKKRKIQWFNISIIKDPKHPHLKKRKLNSIFSPNVKIREGRFVR